MTLPAHLAWLDAWTAQLDGAHPSEDGRAVHRWLWTNWDREGYQIAASFNAALRLEGDHQMQPDVPNLFAGQVDTAHLLFVNINPGWDSRRNAIENLIVHCSEEAAWAFCRSVFTRYPAEVGRMTWWTQMIGIAWRIVHGSAPVGKSSLEKRTWANTQVAGWELFPIHSTSAGFLATLTGGPAAAPARRAMDSSLAVALRFGACVTVVASRIGAQMVNALAGRERWPELEVGELPFPTGTRAYARDGRLVLALPRQLASKYSGYKFDEIASAIRELRTRATS
jgi:hypothetical protein